MTKQLYEEALADLKKVKEVAEADAQRAVLEAVTPRIRDLIEKELLREHGDMEDEELGAPGGLAPEGELMTDVVPVGASADATAPADAISPPDEEGKVTLDLDALCSDTAGAPVPPPTMGAPLPVPEPEYELSMESVGALASVLKATKLGASKEFELMVYRMGEAIDKFKKAGRLVKESAGFRSQITKMISRVEDMYDYVQESVADPAKKSSYETKLEAYFRELNKLTEPTMSQKTKKMMNEEDVTLKLTGLPDDIDLDSVGVDLITGEEGEEGGEADLGAAGGEEGGEGGEGGDLDLGDLGGGDEGEEDMGESRRLSDDTIVEIDEGMLRREIARMRKLREEAVPSVDGHGVGAKEMDDFGGGKDDGEPIEHDIADQSPAKAALPLGENDEMDEGDQMDEQDDQMDEQDDQMDESDDQMDEMSMPMDQGGYMDEQDLDQIGDQRTRDDFGGSQTSVPSKDKSNPMDRHESLQRRAAFEARLQERAKARASSLKKEVAKARAKKDLKKEAALKKEYAQVAKRFNESLDRSNKIKGLMAEAKKSQNGSRQNGGPARPAESKDVASLRNKLAETNLINAKLMFTNKLLQNESLTARQKAQVIEQLDSAKTVREAKLVYESLARTLAGTSKPVNESKDRKVLGSASRATRPASTQTLNEGYEAERWAKLAGITK